MTLALCRLVWDVVSLVEMPDSLMAVMILSVDPDGETLTTSDTEVIVEDDEEEVLRSGNNQMHFMTRSHVHWLAARQRMPKLKVDKPSTRVMQTDNKLAT